MGRNKDRLPVLLPGCSFSGPESDSPAGGEYGLPSSFSPDFHFSSVIGFYY